MKPVPCVSTAEDQSKCVSGHTGLLKPGVISGNRIVFISLFAQANKEIDDRAKPK